MTPATGKELHARHAALGGPAANVVCKACGVAFYRKPSMLRRCRIAHCSLACRWKTARLVREARPVPQPRASRRLTLVCAHAECRKTFTRARWQIHGDIAKSCCSRLCAAAYRSLYGVRHVPVRPFVRRAVPTPEPPAYVAPPSVPRIVGWADDPEDVPMGTDLRMVTR